MSKLLSISKKLVRSLPNEKIKLILYEDLIKNKEVLFKICDFLEIDKNILKTLTFSTEINQLKLKAKNYIIYHKSFSHIFLMQFKK